MGDLTNFLTLSGWMRQIGGGSRAGCVAGRLSEAGRGQGEVSGNDRLGWALSGWSGRTVIEGKQASVPKKNTGFLDLKGLPAYTDMWDGQGTRKNVESVDLSEMLLVYGTLCV